MISVSFCSDDSAYFQSFSQEMALHVKAFSQEELQPAFFPLDPACAADAAAFGPFCMVDLRQNPEKGLELAKSLALYRDCLVMVVAEDERLAMKAYNADVSSYFLDPPDPERAARHLLRGLVWSPSAEPRAFSFKTSSGVRVFSAEQIVYLEYYNHRLVIHTNLGETVTTTTTRLSFGQAAAGLLADERFVRTHASFIVNLLHISEFGLSVLLMDTGASVPLSHSKRKEVKERLEALFA